MFRISALAVGLWRKPIYLCAGLRLELYLTHQVLWHLFSLSCKTSQRDASHCMCMQSWHIMQPQSYTCEALRLFSVL